MRGIVFADENSRSHFFLSLQLSAEGRTSSVGRTAGKGKSRALGSGKPRLRAGRSWPPHATSLAAAAPPGEEKIPAALLRLPLPLRYTRPPNGCQAPVSA